MTKNGGMSHASGFSIETENDKLKSQLGNLKRKFDEEKAQTENVTGKQSQDFEQMEKEIQDAIENENKQRARMSELQEELQQTIKRIEQLQRGAGGFNS